MNEQNPHATEKSEWLPDQISRISSLGISVEYLEIDLSVANPFILLLL
jgi:hypothetical protein